MYLMVDFSDTPSPEVTIIKVNADSGEFDPFNCNNNARRGGAFVRLGRGDAGSDEEDLLQPSDDDKDKPRVYNDPKVQKTYIKLMQQHTEVENKIEKFRKTMGEKYAGSQIVLPIVKAMCDEFRDHILIIQVHFRFPGDCKSRGYNDIMAAYKDYKKIEKGGKGIWDRLTSVFRPQKPAGTVPTTAEEKEYELIGKWNTRRTTYQNTFQTTREMCEFVDE